MFVMSITNIERIIDYNLKYYQFNLKFNIEIIIFI